MRPGKPNQKSAKNSETARLGWLLRRVSRDLNRASDAIAHLEYRLENANLAQSGQAGLTKESEELLRRVVRPANVMTISLGDSGASDFALDDDPPRRMSPKLTGLLLTLMRNTLDMDGIPD